MRPACCQANWVTAFCVLQAPMYASRATSFVYAAHVSASNVHAPPLTASQQAFASIQTSHPTSEPGPGPVPASTVPPGGGGGGGGLCGTPRRRQRPSASVATASSSAVVASPQPATVNVPIDVGTSAVSKTPIHRFIPNTPSPVRQPRSRHHRSTPTPVESEERAGSVNPLPTGSTHVAQGLRSAPRFGYVAIEHGLAAVPGRGADGFVADAAHVIAKRLSHSVGGVHAGPVADVLLHLRHDDQHVIV